MASKLCCTAEGHVRHLSPELPNARLAEATPARRPLLAPQPDSPGSHFTSARTEDLHELQTLFDNAADPEPEQASPPKSVHARFSRPSIYSLHSLHKMTSMHSLIRRKFSRDLSKKDSGIHLNAGKLKKKRPKAEESDTGVQQPTEVPNQQFAITKDHLRRDLLSVKKPADGGYDPDAQVLDDVARNIGKRTPGKRPSLHSIDWSPSAARPTTGSSNGRHSPDFHRAHQINQARTSALSTRLSQVFSSPNLRLDGTSPNTSDRKMRRSHSATSIDIPAPAPLSPLRLPSLKTNDGDGVPWSVSLNESLRLSQFPIPPRLHSTPSKPSIDACLDSSGIGSAATSQKAEVQVPLNDHENTSTSKPHTTDVEIRVQEPTSTSTPRTSTSVQGTVRENIASAEGQATHVNPHEQKEGSPRPSIHLHNMRISHHLRSGSLLSWENLADAPEVPAAPLPLRPRTTSDQSRVSQIKQQLARHDRQTSSSGFASSKVPTRWGRVLPQEGEIPDVASSVYSSRPQSPPDSPGDSASNGEQDVVVHNDCSKNPSTSVTPRKSVDSYPTDDGDTPRPIRRCDHAHTSDTYEPLSRRILIFDQGQLPRNNSVANTKKSKFHEEFSPTPKKRSTPSATIMKFLNSKRGNMRSRSEANLNVSGAGTTLDGAHDVSLEPTERERRTSRSMTSMESEQNAVGREKSANPVWEKALKAHRDERASLFLPKNKELAIHGSPYRERTGSIARSSVSRDDEQVSKKPPSQPSSAPFLQPPQLGNGFRPELSPSQKSRRSAIANSSQELSTAFDKQLEVQNVFHKRQEEPNTVGAWGRYPSHTRSERTLSAGSLDNVHTRDFALEAAIRFASGNDRDVDEDLVDPIACPPSPSLLQGEKRRGKRVGSTRMTKSHSMTFGKTFLKNYAKIFKSSSSEFQRHGYGHRTSVTTGGTLEYPELELLPDVWRSGIIEENSGPRTDANDGHGGGNEPTNSEGKGKGKLVLDVPAATARPEKCLGAVKAAPEVDGIAERGHRDDTARAWSMYYETCIPPYPRASTETGFALEDFGATVRTSRDSSQAPRASMHSRSFPTRVAKHSRNGSRLSHISVLSHASGRPSFVSMAEDDCGVEERSVVSLRRSTMDLVNLCKEQEIQERDKALGILRADCKEKESVRGL